MRFFQLSAHVFAHLSTTITVGKSLVTRGCRRQTDNGCSVRETFVIARTLDCCTIIVRNQGQQETNRFVRVHREK